MKVFRQENMGAFKSSREFTIAVLLVVIALSTTIMGCSIPLQGSQSKVINITAEIEWECKGKTYSAGELVVPIRGVSLPIDNSREAQSVVEQLFAYCGRFRSEVTGAQAINGKWEVIYACPSEIGISCGGKVILAPSSANILEEFRLL